jgi:hypothetical protein
MVGYLTTLSVSRLYNADDKIINEYRAVGAIKKLEGTNELLGENLPHFSIKNLT